MKPEILQLVPLSRAVQQEVDTLYTTHIHFKDLPDPNSLKNVQALISNGAIGASAHLIESLPQLKLITLHGVGLDAVNLERAQRKNIRVSIAQDASTNDVADIAIALLLAVTRQICARDQFVRTGKWETVGRFPIQGISLTGKNIGIMGMGPIAKTIAHRAAAFDMNIAYTARGYHSEVQWKFIPSLIDLATKSDFLIIAASGGLQSKHAVNREVLEALGDRGFIINIGRGSIIDEKALVDCLLTKKIAGAGLDVFANEPNVPHALFRMDNVVLTPHSASATYETSLRTSEMVLQSLKDFFAGKDLPYTVI